jgi:DNA-binding MarR family transcriptional regulator
VNGLDLYLLGRKLAKLGLEALPRSGFQELPPSARAVIVDVFEHPSSTISQIVGRTGLPQSQVSAAVARLRGLKAFTTSPDPADRRRTLVGPAPGMVRRARARAAGSIDETIARALGPSQAAETAGVVAALELAAARLIPLELSRGHTAGGD